MPVTKKLKKELLFEIILFFAVISTMAIFFNNNILLSFLLIVIGAVVIKFYHKKQDVYFFVTGAILGPLAEIICVYFGVWQYANHSFLGIPMWLPLAWGFASMLIKRIVETLFGIEIK